MGFCIIHRVIYCWCRRCSHVGWLFVCLVDGCVVVRLTLLSTRRDGSWEVESRCSLRSECRENADELWLIAVVNSDDINAELFLEVDWRDILRPSWVKSSMVISNYHVLEDNDGSESCVPIWLRRTVHDGCRCRFGPSISCKVPNFAGAIWASPLSEH